MTAAVNPRTHATPFQKPRSTLSQFIVRPYEPLVGLHKGYGCSINNSNLRARGCVVRQQPRASMPPVRLWGQMTSEKVSNQRSYEPPCRPIALDQTGVVYRPKQTDPLQSEALGLVPRFRGWSSECSHLFHAVFKLVGCFVPSKAQ